MITDTNICQLPPEVQAALDNANARLAAMATAHMPPAAALPPPRLAQELAAWGQFKLSPAASALLTPEISSAAFFQQLLARDCLADARRVLAHSLPKRRALWWAMLVAWDAFRNDPPADLQAVLKATTQFVITPTEDLRRALGEWTKRCAANTIAGCLANAVFFSSGSVSQMGLPPVAPRPFITGRLVGVVIYLSAVTRSAAQYKQYLREYLRWGSEIASGRMLWPEPTTAVETVSRLDSYWETPRPHVDLSVSSKSVVGANA